MVFRIQGTLNYCLNLDLCQRYGYSCIFFKGWWFFFRVLIFIQLNIFYSLVDLVMIAALENVISFIWPLQIVSIILEYAGIIISIQKLISESSAAVQEQLHNVPYRHLFALHLTMALSMSIIHRLHLWMTSLNDIHRGKSHP